MSATLPPSHVRAIRRALLRFFDDSGRDLPWRRTADPYAIWISEVMLQQTRVEAVIPYYERWLGRFPDVQSLAIAPIDDVLKAWEGLGYYTRARNLHAAANVVRERHAGELPTAYVDLRALPGVGEYTAGAVASIAYAQRHPAIDGNVRRVMARLLDDPAPSATLLRDVVSALVPRDRPGDFNQALMELGATICIPRNPRCARCPVARYCAARIAGTQNDRPARVKNKATPLIDVATLVLRHEDGRFFVERRPPTGLLAGMWSFPGEEIPSDDDAPAHARSMAARYGTPQTVAVHPLCVVTHIFSHRRERYHCFIVDAARGLQVGGDTAWIAAPPHEIALPRAQQKILAHALALHD